MLIYVNYYQIGTKDLKNNLMNFHNKETDILKELYNLQKSFLAINEIWLIHKDNDNLNAILSDGIPFSKGFNELTLDVLEWSDKCTNEISNLSKK